MKVNFITIQVSEHAPSCVSYAGCYHVNSVLGLQGLLIRVYVEPLSRQHRGVAIRIKAMDLDVPGELNGFHQPGRARSIAADEA